MYKAVKGFLCLCFILLSVGCSGGPTEAQHVDNAQDYLDKGDLNAASIELKNALQQNRENGQARFLLGTIQLRIGNAAEAEKELRLASELGVVDEAVLPLLARTLLAQGRLEELQALSLENLTSTVSKAEVLAAQGLGELAIGKVDQGKVEVAAELIDQAVALDPQSPYVGLARASLLVSKQEYALARKELDDVLERDADYAAAWSLLGDIETFDRNLEQAEAAYTKAIENSADKFDNVLKRAMINIQQKEFAKAQKDIDALKKRAPKHAGINFAQGLIYFYNNQFPEAGEAFELTLQANNRHLQAVFHLAQIQLRLGNQQRAEDYGNQLLSAAPLSIPGRKLMTNIKLANGQFAEAEELMRPVVASREDDVEAINLLARVLLKQDKTDEAIALLEKVITLQPDSADAQLRLATGLLAGGKYDDGIVHIQKALQMDPQLQQAQVLLVQYYLEQKDFTKALAAAEDYRDHYPQSAAPYNLIGRVQLAAGQDADAKKAFVLVREIVPGDPVASHSLAALAARDKEYQEARGYYQDVLKHHDNHLLTLLKLAILDGLEKKEQQMLQHLQQAATAHPKSVLPNVLLARYYMSQGKSEKVPSLMLELSEGQKRSPAVLEVMALSQLAQKQYPAAKVGLEQWLEQQPSSAQAHFLLAQAHAGLGDRAGLRTELERTIELAPEEFAPRLALARLLLLEGEQEKVTEQLIVLDKLSPNNADVLRLKASLARVQGDQETASALLEQIFAATPGTDSMLSIARQKWAMGEQAEALELQEQWVKEHPDDLTATLALAGHYNVTDQVEPAIAQYQEVLKKDHQNVAALNGMAWHLRNQQPARALEYAESAFRLAPQSALVMDTLAVVLLNNGQLERAKRTIERVYEKKPNEPAVRYHRAMIDAAAGDKAAAIEALQTLLGESGDFPEKAEAQQLLAKLQAGG